MIALTSDQFLVLSLLVAWLAGFSMLRRGWTWPRCLGVTLVAIPFARFGLDFVLSIETLATSPLLPPIPEAQHWNGIVRGALYNVLVPTVGLLLVLGAIPRLQTREPLARGFSRAAALLRIPRESWIRDAVRGQALFAAVAVAYVLAVAALLTSLSGVLRTSNEARVFENVTPVIAVLLSLVAGVGEEYCFRGILLERLRASVPLTIAVPLQALFFGLVHAGYGNVAHVLGPFLFGLFMGIVALRLGLVPAMLLHTEIDIAFFALQSRDVAMLGLSAALVIASVAALALTRAEAVRMLFRRPLLSSGRPST